LVNTPPDSAAARGRPELARRPRVDRVARSRHRAARHGRCRSIVLRSLPRRGRSWSRSRMTWSRPTLTTLRRCPPRVGLRASLAAFARRPR